MTAELTILPGLRTPTPSEEEVLLLCARTRMDEGKAQRLQQLLGENLDWDYLLEAATLHCVMPLMYRHLSRL
ncbi:MAG TPA: hypothetical protein VLS25_09895, partial [Dehalococcoidia bacterium]|nr:hypothetical protein [Dehalococcoidia bacterium]